MFKFLQKRERYSEELGYRIIESTPLTQAANQEWLAIPKRDVPELVARYISKMETEESADWCKCVWQIHPDDEDIKPGYCRVCGAGKEALAHLAYKFATFEHEFQGRRTRKVDDHPECPVHTREGMVMYFLEWVFTDDTRD